MSELLNRLALFSPVSVEIKMAVPLSTWLTLKGKNSERFPVIFYCD